jgi:hypothetical protein
LAGPKFAPRTGARVSATIPARATGLHASRRVPFSPKGCSRRLRAVASNVKFPEPRQGSIQSRPSHRGWGYTLRVGLPLEGL